MEVGEGSNQKSDVQPQWIAPHACLKIEFTEGDKCHNLMSWLNSLVKWLCLLINQPCLPVMKRTDFAIKCQEMDQIYCNDPKFSER